MSRPKQRQPRELLTSICDFLENEWAEQAFPTPWYYAAGDAYEDVYPLRDALPPDPPKRSYYGAKGGLRNPF